jgi:hypothetical protein
MHTRLLEQTPPYNNLGVANSTTLFLKGWYHILFLFGKLIKDNRSIVNILEQG